MTEWVDNDMFRLFIFLACDDSSQDSSGAWEDTCGVVYMSFYPFN